MTKTKRTRVGKKRRGNRGGNGRSAGPPPPAQPPTVQSTVQFLRQLLPSLDADSAADLLLQFDDDVNLALEAYYQLYHDDAPGEHLANRELGCGLVNLGNSCYINSAIQFLSRLPGVAGPLITGELLQYINPESRYGSHGAKLTRNMALLLHRLIYTTCTSGTAETAVSPLSFLEAIRENHDDFGDGQQQDADAFCLFLLDTLQEDTNGQDSGLYEPTVRQLPGESDTDTADRVERQAAEHNSSPIRGATTSILKIKRTCSHCKNSIVVMEAVKCIHVPGISEDGEPNNLQECFEKLSRKELLTGDNKYACQHCGCLRDATQETSVQRLADNLIVCLKLPYSYDERVKHSIPLQGIDLSGSQLEQRPNDAAPIYDVVSTVEKHGLTLDTGHCTAKGLSEGNQWLHYDDARVTNCLEDEVITKDTELIALVKRGSGSLADFTNHPPCAAEFAFAGYLPDDALACDEGEFFVLHIICPVQFSLTFDIPEAADSSEGIESGDGSARSCPSGDRSGSQSVHEYCEPCAPSKVTETSDGETAQPLSSAIEPESLLGDGSQRCKLCIPGLGTSPDDSSTSGNEFCIPCRGTNEGAGISATLSAVSDTVSGGKSLSAALRIKCDLTLR